MTDQDNALVFADVPGARARRRSSSAASASACARGSRRSASSTATATSWRATAEWCQPLSVWKEHFRKWVRVPVPEAVLNSSIFFDFRRSTETSRSPRAPRPRHPATSRPGPGCSSNLLAQAVVDKEVPLGLFGRISVETRGSREDVFDIKQPIARICELTRLQGRGTASARRAPSSGCRSSRSRARSTREPAST